jgi:hypothetical protein
MAGGRDSEESKYDVSNPLYKFWRMGSSSQTPSMSQGKFINWWGENVSAINALKQTYDEHTNWTGNNRENILKQAGVVQNAYNTLSGLQNPGDSWMSKIFTATNTSMKKWLDMVEKNITVRPGNETQPEFANETRLSSGGNALGNNLRGRATSLKVLQDKKNSLDNILRALENKMTANSLNLSKVQEEARISNLNRQLAVESKYGQYKINDINRDSSAGLWNSVIGAGMSAVAGAYQKSKTDSLEEQLQNLLKGGNYTPNITTADYTFIS